MIFGIAFLLTGILIITLSFVESVKAPWYVPATFGAFFLILGIALTFGRNGIIIDRKRGTMIHWFGLMVPMKSNYYRLDVFDHISIRKDIHHGDKHTYHVYPVAIRSKNNLATGMIFHEPANYLQARKDAKKLSAFLSLPIVDVSSGKEVTREPDRLNENLREKVKRSRKLEGTLTAPPIMISKIHEERKKLIINIPPRKLTMVEIQRMAFLIIMGFVSFIVVAGFEHLKNIRVNQLPIYLPILLTIILFAVRPIKYQAKKSWKITVSDKYLKVENIGSGRKITTKIPATELEELVIGDPISLDQGAKRISPSRNFLIHIFNGPSKKAITATSNKTSVTFGHGIEERELDYLYKLIKNKITC